MAEYVASILLNIVLVAIVAPLVCIVATPYLLVRSSFETGPYWPCLLQRYRTIFIKSFEFGAHLF